MDPITIALLSGAGGGAVGAFFGWLFGVSQAQAEIQALQEKILVLVEINRKREAEIQRLQATVDQLVGEIKAIKASRGMVMGFIRWVAGEEPEILERYRRIRMANATSVSVKSKMRSEEQSLDAEIANLRLKYPEEMEGWASRLS